MRLAYKTQHAIMLVMVALRQVRRSRGAGGVGVANRDVAGRISDEGKWVGRHYGDQDNLAPNGKPCNGEPDRGLHHPDIQPHGAKSVASRAAAGKFLPSTATR